MTLLRRKPHKTRITAAELREGDWLEHYGIEGAVTRVEHGAWVGFWLTDCDALWLMHHDTPLNVRRT